ncbi:Proteasome inhibitor PI31 subunit [Triplophysa tibetana]|uniref:Proteasome inhibitor PI31 subunit n=1 Tax=Triplophysa tibetana TaxID=1572043 RepID=A0A5A9NXH4_9TELE|nr:Proteasome inhibitor PI31 subunit [Triplophysa tibetana]
MSLQMEREEEIRMLPAGWNGSKELYTLRYRSNDDKSNLLLKAFTVDSTLIFNLMDSKTEKVTDLTVNVNEYIAEGNLQTFESVFKNTDELMIKLKSSLLPPEKIKRQEKTRGNGESEKASNLRDSNNDPLLIPHRAPPTRHPPDCPLSTRAVAVDVMAQPNGSICSRRGRSGSFWWKGWRNDCRSIACGFPRSGFDPSFGIPGVLPQALCPLVRALTRSVRSGETDLGRPDHMPPPGDDMFM